MIKLNKENKRAKEEEKKTEEQIPGSEAPKKKKTMGELRLQKELTDLDIPSHATCDFSEPTIMKFYLTVDLTREKCLWTGGKYKF